MKRTIGVRIEEVDNQLSAREREVLELLVSGYPVKQIAERLGISFPTVRTYVRRKVSEPYE